MTTCYCDGTAHPFRHDYCGRTPAHDPETAIERARAKRRATQAQVVNPDAIGDPSQTPVVQVETDDTCPMHSQNWLYRSVRNNRRLEGLPPQDCACDKKED